MKTRTLIRCERAFTLLEIIISLIVAGVVAAMMAPFLGTAVTRSADSVISAQAHAYLNQVMENITADFKSRAVTQTTPLENLKNQIGAEGSDVSNLDYGTYHVVTNHYITFPSGASVNETADPNGNILKVKISCQGYSLTALFAK